MAFYIHIGCELDGKSTSNFFIDTWIHAIPIWLRLEIMELVLEL